MKNSLQMVEQVRTGLFLAASRTYAEQYIEPIIREKYKLLEPSSDDHDAISVGGVKYEIKASKVLRLPENSATDRSILDRVLYENMINEVAAAALVDINKFTLDPSKITTTRSINKNNAIINAMPISEPIVPLNSADFISSIITTNKNNTATAPT